MGDTRHIVVGDVHGCLDELEKLARSVSLTKADTLCFVGDLVAKGPDSAGVLDFAREAGALAVRGNHDEYVIRWKEAIDAGISPPKIGKSAQEVVGTLSEAQFAWLADRPYSLRITDDVAIVHGGLMPNVTFDAQQVEHLLTLRSIRDDGTPSDRAAEGRPWASLWRGNPFVVFGHDAVRGLQDYTHALGLDTGCVYGNRLTAYIVEEKRLASVPAKRVYAEMRRAEP